LFTNHIKLFLSSSQNISVYMQHIEHIKFFCFCSWQATRWAYLLISVYDYLNSVTFCIKSLCTCSIYVQITHSTRIFPAFLQLHCCTTWCSNPESSEFYFTTVKTSHLLECESGTGGIRVHSYQLGGVQLMDHWAVSYGAFWCYRMECTQQLACLHSSLTWLQIHFLTWEQQLLATLQPPQQASHQCLRFVVSSTFLVSSL